MLAVLTGLAVPAVTGYTAMQLAKPTRQPPTPTPGSLGLAFEDVTFRSRGDGLTLRGWFIPSLAGEVPRTVVLVHGQNGNRADNYIRMLPLAQSLAKAGYNVFTFDLRGHGESEGTYRSFGQWEQRDLEGAIDYLVTRGAAASWVGVIGFSMGAGTVMMTAPGDPRIKAVVEDSGYADIRELVDDALPGASGLPAFLTPVTVTMAKLLIGVDLDSVKPERVVGRIAPRPLLIIHGTVDDTVPLSHARRLAAAAPGADVWILEGVNHVAAYRTQPEEYVRRVLATFARAGN